MPSVKAVMRINTGREREISRALYNAKKKWGTSSLAITSILQSQRCPPNRNLRKNDILGMFPNEFHPGKEEFIVLCQVSVSQAL